MSIIHDNRISPITAISTKLKKKEYPVLTSIIRFESTSVMCKNSPSLRVSSLWPSNKKAAGMISSTMCVPSTASSCSLPIELWSSPPLGANTVTMDSADAKTAPNVLFKNAFPREVRLSSTKQS